MFGYPEIMLHASFAFYFLLAVFKLNACGVWTVLLSEDKSEARSLSHTHTHTNFPAAYA